MLGVGCRANLDFSEFELASSECKRALRGQRRGRKRVFAWVSRVCFEQVQRDNPVDQRRCDVARDVAQARSLGFLRHPENWG